MQSYEAEQPAVPLHVMPAISALSIRWTVVYVLGKVSRIAQQYHLQR